MIAVSVIIPNYNHRQFLQQRIESVLNQTFQDFELIILDDCSKDNSKEIIEKYRDHPKVDHIIYNQQNSGNTFAQWKKGISIAAGEFIWLAESDDYADSDFLKKMIPLISNNKNVGVIYSNSSVVDEKGVVFDSAERWYENWFKPKPFEFDPIQSGHEILYKNLIFTNIIPNASAAIFRKDIVLKNINWIDTSLKNCGDWKLWINILSQSDIAYVRENLNYFRKHSTNVTSSESLIRLEIIRILKERISKTKDKFQLSSLNDSLFIWSFNPAFWNRQFILHHNNIRLYFRNNFNLLSVKLFFRSFFRNIK